MKMTRKTATEMSHDCQYRIWRFPVDEQVSAFTCALCQGSQTLTTGECYRGYGYGQVEINRAYECPLVWCRHRVCGGCFPQTAYGQQYVEVLGAFMGAAGGR